MKYNATNTIIIAVVIGVLGFFGGMKYQQTKTSAFNRGFGMMQGGEQNSNGARRQFGTGASGARMGFRPVSGEIISSDEASITVKLDDGSSKIVMFSNSTAINKAESATQSELMKGTKVMIFGRENTDGTVDAQNIQLNPISPMQR